MIRALSYDRYGGPEVASIIEVESPALNEGQVRVAVRAVGINPRDWRMRQAPPPPGYPHHAAIDPLPSGIGMDLSGEVTEVSGSPAYFDGRPVRPGDRIIAIAEREALREEIVLEARVIAPLVDGLDWVQGASFLTPGLTAQASLWALDLGPWDTAVVSAAAGGVGIIFSQLARNQGAQVIGIASEANHDLLRSLGIVPVSYGDGLIDRIRAIGEVTALQDNFGIEYVHLGLEMGLPPDRICTITAHTAAQEFGLTSTGRFYRSPRRLHDLGKLLASGEVQIPIDSVYAFDDHEQAFRRSEDRHLRGKIVVTVGPGT